MSSIFQCKKGVIDEAFNKRGVEKEAYRNMSGKVRESLNNLSRFVDIVYVCVFVFAFILLPHHTQLVLSILCVQDALTIQDQKVLSKMKRLNAQKHITQTKQQQLEELEREYQRMKAEAGGGAQSADAHARKKEEDAMVGAASYRKCLYIASEKEIMM